MINSIQSKLYSLKNKVREHIGIWVAIVCISLYLYINLYLGLALLLNKYAVEYTLVRLIITSLDFVVLIIIPSICFYYSGIRVQDIFAKKSKISTIIFWVLIGGFFGDLLIKAIITDNFWIALNQLSFENIDWNKINWIILLLNIFIIPINEEFFFRGFLYNALIDKKINYHLVILFCSVIWSLIHLPTSFNYYLFLFSSGIILGYSRFFTKSILVPIAVHIAFNLSSSIFGLLKA